MNACRSWHCLHSNVRRSTRGAFVGTISLIEVSPPHAGHSPSTPMGADWGACTLYPFALERSASPWKVQVPARTSCDRVSIVLEPGPVHQSSLCNIDHCPHLNSAVESGFECYFWVRRQSLPVGVSHPESDEQRMGMQPTRTDLDHQVRSILSFFAKPHVLHASERSSNAPPNKIGVIRVMTISVPHSGQVDEAFSGGNSWPAT